MGIEDMDIVTKRVRPILNIANGRVNWQLRWRARNLQHQRIRRGRRGEGWSQRRGHGVRMRRRKRTPKPDEMVGFVGTVLTLSRTYRINSEHWKTAKKFTEALLGNGDYIRTQPDLYGFSQELLDILARCVVNIEHRSYLAPPRKPRGEGTPRRRERRRGRLMRYDNKEEMTE